MLTNDIVNFESPAQGCYSHNVQLDYSIFRPLYTHSLTLCVRSNLHAVNNFTPREIIIDVKFSSRVLACFALHDKMEVPKCFYNKCSILLANKDAIVYQLKEMFRFNSKRTGWR